MLHTNSAAHAALRLLTATALAASPAVALLSSPATGSAATVRPFAQTQSTFARGAVLHGRAHYALAFGSYSLPNDGSIGRYPASNVTDFNGTLYAVSNGGGAYGGGTLFHVSHTLQPATAGVLHPFGQVSPDGNIPEGTPLNVGNFFYGTTVFGGSLNDGGSWKISTSGINYNWTDFSPKNIIMTTGPLMHKGSRNWGVSQGGGTGGFGTLFSTTMNGVASICYAFSGSDGAVPVGNLLNWNKAFYGVTSQGGANNLGVVFKINAACQLVWAYSFGSHPNDGAAPAGGLVKVGNRLYGTTAYGGQYSQGTIFNITAGGIEQTSYSFPPSGNIGTNPSGSLYYEAVDSKLYGTTQSGGGTSCTVGNMVGCGTIYSFKLPPQSPQVTTVYAFQGGADGSYPLAGIMNDPNGYGLYGTAFYGGSGQAGTVWALTCPSCQ